MILLLSSSSDVNIDLVISWLKYFDHPYSRINADHLLNKPFNLNINKRTLSIENKDIDLSEVNVVWYRNFGRFTKSIYYNEVKKIIDTFDLQQLEEEYYSILKGIASLINKNYWLTDYRQAKVNKVDILNLAKRHGLHIPESKIISTKKQLVSFLNTHKKLISKSAYEPYFIHNKGKVFDMFTKRITQEELKNLPDKFFPSLVQEEIPKQYEIRTFYLAGEFHSIAVFSQHNKHTMLDFRKIDAKRPNRRIPYKLPYKITKKLDSMLSDLGLNCCSIDLIKSSTNNEYYFLEINPVGQFGMVSLPCNYNLYKKIALKLIKMDN